MMRMATLSRWRTTIMLQKGVVKPITWFPKRFFKIKHKGRVSSLPFAIFTRKKQRSHEPARMFWYFMIQIGVYNYPPTSKNRRAICVEAYFEKIILKYQKFTPPYNYYCEKNVFAVLCLNIWYKTGVINVFMVLICFLI